ncbi:hypothetical protein AUEXF2481DRAFT_42902 [Aureobasidium subglaciale EXF-2481]|uniref:Uncharacterized protein n=1 Tax=Aureobasidium subglaciale (strain EXF-2481) TaxID=1043005 RepID=A0A074Y8Y1_AURSE|nr:uncharacterized protein AUEXF2481DRAFT_42902 [Aureobasidium subglaciale EXF-2481]KAI5210872.1 hypothetical protein E4T38_01818 [Aureobasidium subglaciale]KAI5229361.1 hypothetical protein E4T40_01662 [Aureobasidium subglaciale]KAI5232901.1 hypothetical protein E4T41_01816 [Aureobasidium subglaciale]KAI5266228.1 hypothetical protein E4T46_01659 [Aureobasidium subglaciale]KEQ92459.1 hypothetical protein AUEXF2481DRAFT_42902 [Aureobasidium subglaciale EXF-2481]
MDPFSILPIVTTTAPTWAPITSDAYGIPTPASIYSSTDSSSNEEGKSFGSLYRNYFVLVAIVIVIAFVGGCVFYRRKKRIVYRTNVQRQAALSRDLEDQGLHGNRGWGWGALSRDYSSGPTPHGQPVTIRGGTGMTTGRRRREDEGLNEVGEAPPAYKPAPDDNHTLLETGQSAPSTDATIAPALPRPTLGRENTGLKPPDYTETVITNVAPGRGLSSTTIPTSTATNSRNTNPDRDVELGHLPGYTANDTRDRR